MTQVFIGVDPHKLSATIEVVDERETVLATGRFSTDKAGYAAMRKHVASYPERVWAVEGSNGAGRPLAQRLLADGEPLVDVPAKLSARVRELDTGHNRKTDAQARELLAQALTQLGFGAENGLWRNIYLRGAEELRGRIADPSPDLASRSVLGALTIEQLFDSISIRVDGMRAAQESLCVDWVFTDLERTYRTELSNGALIHGDAGYGGGDPTLTVTLTKAQMLGILAGHGLEDVQSDGDTTVLGTLLGLLDTVDHSFAMVTP